MSSREPIGILFGGFPIRNERNPILDLRRLRFFDSSVLILSRDTIVDCFRQTPHVIGGRKTLPPRPLSDHVPSAQHPHAGAGRST
jgi:hypothetical protein